MSKLVRIFEDITVVHEQLDNLVKIAYFKLHRTEDVVNTDATPEHLVKRHNEDEYDMLAYINAINLKFQLYCTLVFKYLNLYLKEQFSISLTSSQHILQQAYTNNLLTPFEYKKLSELTSYLKCIAKPDAYGNYEYSDDIIEFYHTLQHILLKLNETASLQKVYVSSASLTKNVSL